MEPNAKTYKYALFSPNTATVDPLEVLKALESELREKEVRIFYNSPYRNKLNDDLGIIAGDKTFKAEKLLIVQVCMQIRLLRTLASQKIMN